MREHRQWRAGKKVFSLVLFLWLLVTALLILALVGREAQDVRAASAWDLAFGWFHLVSGAYMLVSVWTIGAIIPFAYWSWEDMAARRRARTPEERKALPPQPRRGAFMRSFFRAWAIGMALFPAIGVLALAFGIGRVVLVGLELDWFLFGAAIRQPPFFSQEGAGAFVFAAVYAYFAHKVVAVLLLARMKYLWRRSRRREPGELPLDSVFYFLFLSVGLYISIYWLVAASMFVPEWLYVAIWLPIPLYLLARGAFPREARMLHIRRLLWGAGRKPNQETAGV